jgi:hypothetical protein
MVDSTNEHDNFEWMTISEIRSTFPSVKRCMDDYPSAMNIYVYPRCKRFSDNDVHLTVRFDGHPEHVEHAHALGINNIRAYEDESPHLDKVLPHIHFEQIDDKIARVMAEAIAGCSLPLVQGQWLFNHHTREYGQFREFALTDEMQIVVQPKDGKRLKTWNLEDILVDADESQNVA